MRKAAFVVLLVMTSLGGCGVWGAYWLRPVWEIWSQESGRSVPDDFRLVLFPKLAALAYADRECQTPLGKREAPVVVAWSERDQAVVECGDGNGGERFVKRSDFDFIVSDSSEGTMIDALVRKQRTSGGPLRDYDASISCSRSRGDVTVRFAEVWPNSANRYEYAVGSDGVLPVRWERGGRSLSSLSRGEGLWWGAVSLSLLSVAGWAWLCVHALRNRASSRATF